jgi:hypothetical protein
VPLSEHEQRLLEQMERALYAEDPKFASALRGADLRRRYRRRAVLALLAFVLGICLLMTGAIAQITPVGVAGFVVMLVSASYAITMWRRLPPPGEISNFPAGSSPRAPRRVKAGFMNRVEERWRRRRDGMGQ